MENIQYLREMDTPSNMLTVVEKIAIQIKGEMEIRGLWTAGNCQSKSYLQRHC